MRDPAVIRTRRPDSTIQANDVEAPTRGAQNKEIPTPQEQSQAASLKEWAPTFVLGLLSDPAVNTF